MKKMGFAFLFSLSSLFSCHAMSQQSVNQEIRQVLSKDVQLPEAVADDIMLKINVLVQDEKLHGMLREFSHLVKKWQAANTADNEIIVAPDDAVLVAPESHEVLFENDKIRVLWAEVKKGEIVPLHRHQWQCVYLVVQGARFMAESANGLKEEESYGVCTGAELDAGVYGYENIGESDFQGLVFEFKQV